MKTHMQDMAAFHERFGLEYSGNPRALPKELADFRMDFMREEMREYVKASHVLHLELTGPEPADQGVILTELEDQLDAMVDLVYVVIGTAYLHGYGNRWQEAWDRVHYANMQKVRAERAEDSKRGSTFDVVKPKGWRPPSHTDLVEDNIHRSQTNAG